MKKVILTLLCLFGLGSTARADDPFAAIEGYTVNHESSSGAGWYHTNFSLNLWLYDPVGYDVFRVTIYMTDNADGTGNWKSISSGVDWQASRPNDEPSWYATTYNYNGNNYEYRPSSYWDAVPDGVGGWKSVHYVTSMTVEFGNWYWDDSFGVWRVAVGYTCTPYYYNTIPDNNVYQCECYW